jgi:hypothetical protein
MQIGDRLQQLRATVAHVEQEYSNAIQGARQDFADQSKSLRQVDPQGELMENLGCLLASRERLEEERRELHFLRSFRLLEERRYLLLTKAPHSSGCDFSAVEEELLEILHGKERLMDEEVYQSLRRSAACTPSLRARRRRRRKPTPH